MTSRLDRWSRSYAVGRRFTVDLVPHRMRLVGVALLSVLVTAVELIKPWPIGLLFDHALIPQEGSFAPDARTLLYWGVGAIVTIALLQALLGYARTVSLANVGHLVVRAMRFRVFAHLTRLSPAFHNKHKSGDLLMRIMGDVPMVEGMLVTASMEVFTRGLLVVGTVSVMLWVDPILTLTAFGIVPPLVWLVRWISEKIRIAVRKQRQKEGTLADYMHEALAATQTIQSLGGGEHVVRQFARSNRRTARAGLKATRLAARLSSSVEAMLGVALAAVVLFGGLRVLDRQMNPGELLVFVSYVRSLLKPVRSTSKNAARIAKGTACGERILSLLDADNPVQDAPDAIDPPRRPSTLVFEDVAYAYDGGAPALDGLNARFERGKLSALVGRSGAGKSTTTLLAQRMMDPERGRVLMDGEDLRAYRVDGVRASVGLCLQQAVFFGDSIRENLLLAAPEATDEELWAALREAGADEFLEGLPEGLDTVLGANGVGLSGGQKSRLSLARSLLRDAPILVVDEPFAGLDQMNARRVAETLAALSRERIVIVIAHDLEGIEAFDHIVFLEEGRNRGEGTHATLAAEIPSYVKTIRAVAPAEDRPDSTPDATLPGRSR